MKFFYVYKYVRWLVPREGVEPSRSYDQRILSPSCLPVPPSGRSFANLGFLLKKAMFLFAYAAFCIWFW